MRAARLEEHYKKALTGLSEEVEILLADPGVRIQDHADQE